MLVNEVTPNDKILQMLHESHITKDDDDLKLSNQMLSFSNLQSFNDNFIQDGSIPKENSRAEIHRNQGRKN